MTIVALTPVENSSNVAAHGYLAGERILAVQFKSGQCYHYFDVEPEMVQQMHEAPSIGGYISKNIRGNYRCELQREAAAEHE